MEDIIGSSKQFLKERMNTPLFANILFCWCVINWEIIYVTLFVDQELIKPLTRIEYIRANAVSVWELTVYPICLGVIATFLFPLINYVVYRFREWVKRIRKKALMDIHKTTPISLVEYREAVTKREEAEAMYIEAINNYQDEKGKLETVKNENIRLEGQLIKARAEQSRTDLEYEEKYTLKELTNNLFRIHYFESGYTEPADFTSNSVRLRNDNYGFTADMIQNIDGIIRFRIAVLIQESSIIRFSVHQIFELNRVKFGEEYNGVRYDLLDNSKEDKFTMITVGKLKEEGELGT